MEILNGLSIWAAAVMACYIGFLCLRNLGTVLSQVILMERAMPSQFEKLQYVQNALKTAVPTWKRWCEEARAGAVYHLIYAVMTIVGLGVYLFANMQYTYVNVVLGVAAMLLNWWTWSKINRKQQIIMLAFDMLYISMRCLDQTKVEGTDQLDATQSQKDQFQQMITDDQVWRKFVDEYNQSDTTN